jgi:hypothetical protein
VLVHHSNVTTWGSGIEQIMDGFYKLTIRPMLVAIEQAVRRKVLTPRQRSYMVAEFALDALLRGSPAQRAELYSKNVQNGIMTRNECRQLENLPPMSGADDLTAQSNLIPLSKLGEATTAPEAVADDSMKWEMLRMETKHAAEIAQLKEQKKPEPAPININVTTPDVTAEVHAGDAHFHAAPTTVNAEITTPETTVNVAAPNVKVENVVEPTPVTLEATIKNEIPAVTETRIVGLPARVTTSSVKRDSDGNIVTTTQTERDV